MEKVNTNIEVTSQRRLEEKRGSHWVLARPEITLLITIGGVVVAMANLWIISKLAPITENLAVITNRVSALEDTNGSYVPRLEFNAKFDDMTGRLDRIESKLDRAIETKR